ncbi:hypothetical protein JRG19_10140 [Pseudoclavibacter alba]|uniref:hypothetical protein n=1 Tax=Pseudoclavibacter albus TaxID=272241 RepID=UPI0019D1AEF1|nr:hypothetical protein [Pseudoclavibacter alba]MBN6778889.1 hypothetical protein [Pseudoclavibacter alba]
MSLATPNTRTITSIERVRNALVDGGYKPGRKADNFTALCPVHGDHNHSLSVTYDRSRGMTLVNCFACQAPYDEIAAALGLTAADLFDEPLPADRRGRQRNYRPRKTKPVALPKRVAKIDDTQESASPQKIAWKQVTSYPYATLTGEVIQEVIREEATVNGKRQKRFRQKFLNQTTGRWVSKRPEGFEPVLYHAAEVRAARENGTPIWLVEGEKDADNGRNAGLVATTNAQGATNFPEALLDELAGAHVCIIADRDAAGYTRAAGLWESLTPRAATVRIYLPAVDEAKADLSDHLEAGKGLDELIEISSDDVQALAHAAEVERHLTGIRMCLDEATARDKRGEPVEAKRWAEEAHRKYRNLPAVDDAINGGELSTVGADALKELAALRERAALLVTDTYAAAGIDAPLIDSTKPSNQNVIAMPTPNKDIARRIAEDYDDDNVPNESTEYVVRRGETVVVKWERDGENYRRRYKTILRCWAVVRDVFVADDGDDVGTTRPTDRMVVDFYRWRRDEDGKVIRDEDGKPVVDEATVSWDADQIKDGTWIQALPWPGLLESSSRRGKDQAWDAIHNAKRGPSYRRTVYTSTGWRFSEVGEPFFVHGAGAIDPNGVKEVDVDLQGSFNRFYQMPAPVTNAAQLRKAWITGVTPALQRMPARVIAPLLGFVWQAPYKQVPLLLHLYGPPGTAKTSSARIGMHFFAPELRYTSTDHRATFSAANNTSSQVGMIRALGAIDHLPILVDDFAPDGDAAAAEKKLSDLARYVYNGQPRTTGKARGGTREDKKLRASVITSAEIVTQNSAGTRMVTIPIDGATYTEAPEKVFRDLEQRDCREARGLLGASFIHWLSLNLQNARDYEDYLLEHSDEDSELAYWREQIRELGFDPGVGGRMMEGAQAMSNGIFLMTSMLTSLGALTETEAAEFRSWAREGIREAISLQITDSADPGHLFMQYLREALRSGSCYIAAPDGSQPATRALELGWTRKPVGPGGIDSTIVPASNTRVGTLTEKHGQLLLQLFTGPAMTAAKTAARNAQEMFADSAVSIGGAMKAHGWIIPDSEGKTARQVRIDSTRKLRAWVIPLDVLLGDEPSDDDDITREQEPTEPEAPTQAPTLDPSYQPPHEVPATQASSPAPADTGQATEASQVAELEIPTDEPAATPDTRPVETAAATTKKPVVAAKKSKTNAQTPIPASPYRACAAVLDDDKLHFPDGEIEELPFPIQHLGDIARLVKHARLGTRTSAWTDRNGELQERVEPGQIWITGEQAARLGIPIDKIPNQRHGIRELIADATLELPFINDAVADGWEYSGSNKGVRHMVASTRVWGSDAGEMLRAMLVLIPGIRYEAEDLLEDGPTAGDLALRLQKLADTLGYPYQVSATTTAQNLMRELRPRDRREIFIATPRIEPHDFMVVRDIHWTRKPIDAEASHTYIHGYDRGASYLAAAQSLNLGIGRPEHVIAPEFDAKLPGYWKVQAPDPDEWLWPNPLNPVSREWQSKDQWWATTPRIQFAIEQGYDLEILEAWVWPTYRRFLDPWVKRLSDARTSLDTADPNDKAARNIVKAMYVRSLGMLDSSRFAEGGGFYHPDWYHHIQERASTNILRRIKQIGNDTGRWPVAIDKDLVLYTSNEEDPAKAWPGLEKHFGRGLGQFKPEMTGRLEDVLPTLDGTPFTGKQFMTYL